VTAVTDVRSLADVQATVTSGDDQLGETDAVVPNAGSAVMRARKEMYCDV
jgi:NADP-dependent 3-hydroxy acid dehydrogenase YdfG